MGNCGYRLNQRVTRMLDSFKGVSFVCPNC